MYCWFDTEIYAFRLTYDDEKIAAIFQVYVSAVNISTQKPNL